MINLIIMLTLILAVGYIWVFIGITGFILWGFFTTLFFVFVYLDKKYGFERLKEGGRE